MKKTSTILVAGTLALGMSQSGAAAAHGQKPIARLDEIRAAYLALLAGSRGIGAIDGGERETPEPAEERLAQSWQNFPNFPNWGNWNNWANGWRNS